MSLLRSLAHLQEQLGEKRLAALIDSGNTGKARELCDQLLKGALPTEFTAGGRAHEVLSFLKGDETSVVGYTMVKRTKEMSANLGKEDAEHLLANQGDIPPELRGKVAFVFTDCRHPGLSGNVYVVCWREHRREWVGDWFWLGNRWYGYCRVLRRK